MVWKALQKTNKAIVLQKCYEYKYLPISLVFMFLSNTTKPDGGGLPSGSKLPQYFVHFGRMTRPPSILGRFFGLLFESRTYGMKPPYGLWCSPFDLYEGVKSSPWLEFVNTCYDKWLTDNNYPPAHRFVLQNTEGICAILTKEDADSFYDIYGVKGSRNINWGRVMKDYSGIFVHENAIHEGPGVKWTYGWDITSLVIWNTKKHLKHILSIEYPYS